VLFFLDQLAEYELHPPKTQKQKRDSVEVESNYNDWFGKLQKSNAIYERLFSGHKPENSPEYIQDPFYLDNRRNRN